MNEILVVRLGAMGDVLHVLPAVASLRASFPKARLTWVVEPRWAPLLACVDEVIPVNRRQWGSVREAWASLRRHAFDLAIDFQGLIKSALVARLSGARRILGYRDPRESPASWFYTERVATAAAHIVEKHLDLAKACGAATLVRDFPLPEGKPEGELPPRYVLACPFAGWPAKEWPLASYEELARLLQQHLRLPLVLNGHAAVESALRAVPGVLVHVSSLPGLIHATRHATAIVGLDSGPLHLAAALNKPGVAIFGPTDPARNGPYGSTIQVLRSPTAVTSYKRRAEIDPSMRAISPRQVCDALEVCLR